MVVSVAMGTTIRHIFLLSREELLDLWGRRRALLSIALYLCFVALSIYGLRQIDDTIQQVLQRAGAPASSTEELIKLLSQLEQKNLLARLLEWPIAYPLFQFFSLLVLPTLVALTSCDLISTDLSRGTLRFLMLRTTRAAYFFSKFLSHCFIYFVLHLVAVVLLTLTLLSFTESVTFADCMEPMLFSIGLMIPFILFLVATTQCVSTFTKRAFSTLLLLHILWLFVIPVTANLLPLGMSAEVFAGLIAPFDGLGLEATGVLSGWAVAFLGATYWYFEYREI